MEKIELKVNGMLCGHCVKAIEGSVGRLPGIETVLVDLENGNVAVKFNSRVVTLDNIKETIDEQGYDVA